MAWLARMLMKQSKRTGRKGGRNLAAADNGHRRLWVAPATLQKCQPDTRVFETNYTAAKNEKRFVNSQESTAFRPHDARKQAKAAKEKSAASRSSERTKSCNQFDSNELRKHIRPSSKSSPSNRVSVQVRPPVLQAGKGLAAISRESLSFGAMPSVCNPYADTSMSLLCNDKATPT